MKIGKLNLNPDIPDWVVKFRLYIISAVILLLVGGLVLWRSKDMPSPIQTAGDKPTTISSEIDAANLVQGLFAPLKPEILKWVSNNERIKSSIKELAKKEEEDRAELAKQTGRIDVLETNVDQLQKRPVLTREDVEKAMRKEVEKLNQEIEALRKQSAPVSELKAVETKVSLLESALNALVGKANAQPAPSGWDVVWKDGDRSTRKLRVEQVLVEKCGNTAKIDTVDAAKVELILKAPSHDAMQELIVCKELVKAADSEAAKRPDEQPARVAQDGEAGSLRTAKKECPPGRVWEGYPILMCL